MKKSLIGWFVNWWLDRQGWPQIVSYYEPLPGEAAAPFLAVSHHGRVSHYLLHKSPDQIKAAVDAEIRSLSGSGGGGGKGGIRIVTRQGNGHP